ncbi:MAG: hypothetical protein AAB859_01470 [Patescibacteria group bacterium]
MLTKIDINKLKEVFVTKDEFKDLKNDIVTFKDEILHEIIKLRDDITVVIGYRDMIEDHEQRIIKLEKTDQN